MNYYVKGDAANAGKIKAAFEKLGIDVLDFGFADKTLVYCSIGGCVQSLPYSINLMHILYSHPDYQELELTVKPKFKVGDRVIYNGNVCTITFMDEVYYDFDGGVAGCRIEKQDELLSAASKFKVGDWVVTDYGKVSQVVSVDNAGDGYTLDDGVYFSGSWCDMYRLWTIADAKDGDVLVSGIDNPFIYNGNIEFSFAGAYVGVSRNGRIRLDMFPSKAWTSIKDVKPATIEQRHLLFSKIREVGYQWDAEKKELRKRTIEPAFKVGDEIFRPARNEYFKIKDIEKDNGTVWYVTTRTRIADNDKRIGEIVRINAFYQNGYSIAPKTHYDIANLHAGMPVLVRNSNESVWVYLQYSHRESKYSRCFNAGGQYWYQCIPFNEDTKHLLGATDMCPEEYINWVI